MKISQGSPKAMSLFERLKKDGDLVDIYSEDFFGRQPTIAEDPDTPFLKGFLEEIEYLENAPEEEKKPKNHLIFIFLDDYKKGIKEEFIEIYPPLKKILSGWHAPDFLILNLYTQQMLCVGFGRKNGLFIIDAKTAKSINYFGSASNEDYDYISKFTDHDVSEAVNDFLTALHELSYLMYEYDNLRGNVETVSTAIDSGPSEDGFYYIEDEDDVGYTESEIKELLNDYNELQAGEDKAMKMIKVFFPQCQRGELNTGDY
jgi:hypothetical protein